jgi:hypothetical protein
MAKSRKNRSIKNKTSKFLKTIGKTTKKAVPVIKSGLKTIGTKAEPVVKKGAETVYGAIKTGFDLGVNSIKSLAKSAKKSKRRHR